jgi:hypothetical protein
MQGGDEGGLEQAQAALNAGADPSVTDGQILAKYRDQLKDFENSEGLAVGTVKKARLDDVIGKVRTGLRLITRKWSRYFEISKTQTPTVEVDKTQTPTIEVDKTQE